MARDPAENSSLLSRLRDVYARTDAAFAGMSCDASTECCQFGVTGREPYPTAIEIAELTRAMAASGRKIATSDGKRRLTTTSTRRCPLLSPAGRCLVYPARPFGCRTFFCDRAEGQAPRRADVLALSREIAALSDRFDPKDPGPRPLSRIKW